MEIKPSIAHKLAEISEEIANDIKGKEHSNLLELIHYNIRKAVFQGKTNCYITLPVGTTNQAIKSVIRTLRKQKLSVKRGLASKNNIKVYWKRSWLISVLKLHQ